MSRQGRLMRTAGSAVRGCAAAMALCVMLPAAGAAQDYRSSVGWNAGAVWTSSLNAGAQDGRKLEPGAGWVLGLQGDHWFWGGSFGVRLGGGYTHHYGLEWTDGRQRIGNWTAEANLLARFFAPDPERVFAPYVAAGVGGVRYGLGRGDALTLADADAYYSGRQRYRLAAQGALGLDVLSRWIFDDAPVFFRLEAADQVALESPLRRLSDGDHFGLVHNIRFTLGLHAGLGTVERAPAPVPVPVVAAGR